MLTGRARRLPLLMIDVRRAAASAVRSGNRPAPSVGRHLTGQKGPWDGPYDYLRLFM